jgi:hypothetical protein
VYLSPSSKGRSGFLTFVLRDESETNMGAEVEGRSSGMPSLDWCEERLWLTVDQVSF